MGRQLINGELWGSSPHPSTILIGDSMTIDHKINQLLIEIMTERVFSRVEERLKKLKIKVEKNT